jgi:hypothetical protein
MMKATKKSNEELERDHETALKDQEEMCKKQQQQGHHFVVNLHEQFFQPARKDAAEFHHLVLGSLLPLSFIPSSGHCPPREGPSWQHFIKINGLAVCHVLTL